ncbi:hypothetical protein CICLE_v10030130mg [Citrus x clementina]|uniref:Uncharacterized protein n=1 Tax=Citrus clementina TaxID=85681 RepID=V4UEL8_CITCL|nr:hypothetical protein CICLE_v10030130mg [Citrus x clementina]
MLDSVGRFSSRKGEKVRFCFFFPLRKNPSFGWRVFFFLF